MSERITLPTKIGVTQVAIVDTTSIDAVVETSAGVRFSLPLALIPFEPEVGARLSLRITDPAAEEMTHTVFAQRLLEDIMN